MRDFVKLIHERAMLVANKIHTSEKELIGILQEMDQCEGYFDYECDSLWDYCKKILKLSDYNASTMVGIARKSVAIPELKAAVLEGRVELSKARKIIPVLTKENQGHWLSQAETLSKKDLERAVAEHSPKLATKEVAKPVSRNRIQFGCGLDEDIFEKFKEIQDLVSQKSKKSADYEATLVEMILFYEEKNDPLKKAERSQERNQKRNQIKINRQGNFDSEVLVDEGINGGNESDPLRHSPGYVATATTGKKSDRTQRRYPAKLKHEINLRDGHQCTYKNSEKRCTNRRWLQLHHKIHVQHGGKDSLDNLQTLCWSHHKMVHKKNGVSDLYQTYDFQPLPSRDLPA